MSFSSMPQPKGLLVTPSALQNLYSSLTPSSVNNSILNSNASGNAFVGNTGQTLDQFRLTNSFTPQDAGFVGFTGVRANANSFQVVDSRGNSAFISGQQAANLGIVNSSGLDFTGVQRFLPQNISFATTPAPVASGTHTPGQTTIPSNTSNPTSGRSISDTVNSGLADIKKFFQGPQGAIALAVVAGLGIFLVVKK